MNFVYLCGLGIIAAAICVIIRKILPEGAFWVSIAAGVVILGAAVAMLAPSVKAFTDLSEAAGVDGEFAKILLKALAVCYLTTLCAGCARDAGESAIAAKLELGGRAAVAAISLPVFTRLAELITALIA
ncbi:MAG: stage III sporulation protein AD [Oscillospiraceae bacterium]|nr:stage III sporulation protein AD [Oscillospiraceae bacterium]